MNDTKTNAVDLSVIPSNVLSMTIATSSFDGGITLHSRIQALMNDNNQSKIEASFHSLSSDGERLVHFTAYSKDIVFSLVATPFGDKDIMALWRDPPSVVQSNLGDTK